MYFKKKLAGFKFRPPDLNFARQTLAEAHLSDEGASV
jgi:hypothetical protein